MEKLVGITKETHTLSVKLMMGEIFDYKKG